MKCITTLVILYIGISAANAYLHEEDMPKALRNASKRWHNKCKIMFGVSDEDIFELRECKFEEKGNVKQYHFCTFIVSNAITPQMKFNTKIFRKYLPKKGVKLYKHCFNKAMKNAVKPEDVTWRMMRCVCKKNPDNFIVI